MGTKRDIYNHLGVKCGELELPNTTSEEVWTEKLAEYAKPPVTTEFPDVTPRQIRQALILSGVSMSQITDALNTLPEPMKSLANAEWEYSNSFQRTRPLVASVGQMLGWSSTQLDALWKFAGSL